MSGCERCDSFGSVTFQRSIALLAPVRQWLGPAHLGLLTALVEFHVQLGFAPLGLHHPVLLWFAFVLSTVLLQP
jgi:hypothetical protein